MDEYGGSAQGNFIEGQGFYIPVLKSAIQANTVWLSDKAIYHKYIYDPEQVEQELRHEREQDQDKARLGPGGQVQTKADPGPSSPTRDHVKRALVQGGDSTDIRETKENSENSQETHQLATSLLALLRNLDEYR